MTRGLLRFALLVLLVCHCDADFQFYRNVEFLHPSDSEANGTEVLFVFDSASYLSSNRLDPALSCSDIGFSWIPQETNSTNTTNSSSRVPVPFWYESGCGGPTTSIWILLEPCLPSGSTRTIRFHYGFSFGESDTFGYSSPLPFFTDTSSIFLFRNSPLPPTYLEEDGSAGGGRWFIVRQYTHPSLFPALDNDRPFVRLGSVDGFGFREVVSNFMTFHGHDRIYFEGSYNVSGNDGVRGPTGRGGGWKVEIDENPNNPVANQYFMELYDELINYGHGPVYVNASEVPGGADLNCRVTNGTSHSHLFVGEADGTGVAIPRGGSMANLDYPFVELGLIASQTSRVGEGGGTGIGLGGLPEIPEGSLFTFVDSKAANQSFGTVPVDFEGQIDAERLYSSLLIRISDLEEDWGHIGGSLHSHPISMMDLDLVNGTVVDDGSKNPFPDMYVSCDSTNSSLFNWANCITRANTYANWFVSGHSRLFTTADKPLPGQEGDAEYPPSINIALRKIRGTTEELRVKKASYESGMLLLTDDDSGSSVPPLGWTHHVGFEKSFLRLLLVDPEEDKSRCGMMVGELSGAVNHTHTNMVTKYGLVLLNSVCHRPFVQNRTIHGPHSHTFRANMSESAPPIGVETFDRIPPCFDFNYIVRSHSAVVVQSIGDEIGLYDCFGFHATSEHVCGGVERGECVAQDVCICLGVSYAGDECLEHIENARYVSELEIRVSFRFSLVLLYSSPQWESLIADDVQQASSPEFPCDLIVKGPIEAVKLMKKCSWIVEAAQVTEFVLQVNSSSPVISRLGLTTVTGTRGQNVTLHVERLAWNPPPSFLAFLPYVIGFSVAVVILVGLVVIVSTILVSVQRKRMERSQEKISKIMELEDIDLLIQEKAARAGDPSVFARVKIDKALFELDFSEIKLKSRIGAGGSDCQVFLGEWNGAEVAFKQFTWRSAFSKDPQNYFESFEREVSVISSVRHPFILRFYGACIKPPRVGFVMEFCSVCFRLMYIRFCANGDLCQFLYDRPDYPLSERIRLAREVASAMHNLHEACIIHRDLKPENVLVAEDFSTRLMDFGLSKSVRMTGQLSKMTRRIGTSFFMAPEVFGISGLPYGLSADVYSFGILLYELLTSDWNPYGDVEHVEMRAAMDPAFRPSFGRLKKEDADDIPMVYQRLAALCWEGVPSARPTFDLVHSVLAKQMSIDECEARCSGEFSGDEDESEGEDEQELSVETGSAYLVSLRKRLQQLRKTLLACVDSYLYGSLIAALRNVTDQMSLEDLRVWAYKNHRMLERISESTPVRRPRQQLAPARPSVPKPKRKPRKRQDPMARKRVAAARLRAALARQKERIPSTTVATAVLEKDESSAQEKVVPGEEE